MDDDEIPRNWLTVGEVARLLRISPTGAYRLLERKLIVCYVIGGSYRILEKDLHEYLEKVRQPARAQIN